MPFAEDDYRIRLVYDRDKGTERKGEKAKVNVVNQHGKAGLHRSLIGGRAGPKGSSFGGGDRLCHPVRERDVLSIGWSAMVIACNNRAQPRISHQQRGPSWATAGYLNRIRHHGARGRTPESESIAERSLCFAKPAVAPTSVTFLCFQIFIPL